MNSSIVIDDIYRTTNMNELGEVSSQLLRRYSNNKQKTLTVMNLYKRRRDLIKKGKDIHKVYIYTPSNTNKLKNVGTIISKKNQSMADYIRGKTSFRNGQQVPGFESKKFIAVKPFVIFGKKVNGFVSVPPSLDIEEAHGYARFIERSLVALRIGKLGKPVKMRSKDIYTWKPVTSNKYNNQSPESGFKNGDNLKIKFTAITSDQGGAIFF